MIKRKGLNMWSRFVAWWNAPTNTSHILVAIIFVVAVLGAIAIMAYNAPTTTDIYLRTYNDCMEHENMTQYRCHEIALQAIGD